MKRMKVKGQGATEYLLILAAVLVVVAVAVYYVTRAGPSVTITGTATIKTTDNTKVIFKPTKMIPDKTIAANAWEWAVYHEATKIGGATGTVTLEEGIEVELSCDSAVQSGDVVKVKYKGTWVDAATVA
jgi:hypothetical protein